MDKERRNTIQILDEQKMDPLEPLHQFMRDLIQRKNLERKNKVEMPPQLNLSQNVPDQTQTIELTKLFPEQYDEYKSLVDGTELSLLGRNQYDSEND